MKRAFSPRVFAGLLALLMAAIAGRVLAINTSAPGASPSETPFDVRQSSGSGGPAGTPSDDLVTNPFAQQNTPRRAFYEQSNPLRWIAPVWQHCVLVGSVLLFSLSLYLFFESITLHRFAFRGIEDAPSAESGLLLVCVSAALVVFLLGSLQFAQLAASDPAARADIRQIPIENIFDFFQFIASFFIIHYPLAAVPGIALASLLPSVLAVYKFLVASSVLQRREDAAAPANVGRAFIGIWIGVINFLASIATLITFLRLSK